MIDKIEVGMSFYTKQTPPKLCHVSVNDSKDWGDYGIACKCSNDIYGRKVSGPNIGRLIAGGIKDFDFDMKRGPFFVTILGDVVPWDERPQSRRVETVGNPERRFEVGMDYTTADGRVVKVRRYLTENDNFYSSDGFWRHGSDGRLVGMKPGFLDEDTLTLNSVHRASPTITPTLEKIQTTSKQLELF